MNIAVLSEKFIVAGGIERYLQNIVGELLDQGHQVSIYTTKIDEKLDFVGHRNLRIARQNLSWCPKKMRRIFFRRFLQKHLRNHCFNAIFGVITPYSPQVSICCGTTLGGMLIFKYRLFKPLEWIKVFYERKQYREARIISTEAEDQKNELIKLFKIPAERIRLLPPPISTSFQVKSVKSRLHYRQKYSLDDKRWNLLFVSTNHRRKGLPTILAMLKILQRDDCRVVVVGPSQRGIPNSRYVRYLGYREQVDELYQACDATLLLSRYEPFGQVVGESLLSGTPVFISDRVGAKSLLEEGMGWVVPAGDPAALATAVASFFDKAPAFPVHKIAPLQSKFSVTSHVQKLLQFAEENPMTSVPRN